IGILAVMFLMAVVIMGWKLVYLGQVSRGNQRFLAQFRETSEDPAALERRLSAAADKSGAPDALDGTDGEFGASTLWPVYHTGMREVIKRLEGQPAGADRVRTLGPQSIEAIRATLDATLTRSTQRLNSQMVWLTIAIAGGPFLGLLGTVVGVMITFA